MYVKSIVPWDWEDKDDVNLVVDFSVLPGFLVRKNVLKCEFYLRDLEPPWTTKPALPMSRVIAQLEVILTGMIIKLK
jgi:hypothetical protein